MRGAAFLSGVKDAVVVDIGGTTTDCGVLQNGFPRLSSVACDIGGVRSNFRMPDVLSFGLGGGSILKVEDSEVEIGPDSVGYEIQTKALIFGGKVATATDAVVAQQGLDVLDTAISSNAVLPSSDAIATEKLPLIREKIRQMIANAVEEVKVSSEEVPILLVGGGSIIAPNELSATSQLQRPPFFSVANAVGAAISQVSGTVDAVVSLDATKREDALVQIKADATAKAVQAGAMDGTVEIISVDETQIAYVPGNMCRFQVKAVGSIFKTGPVADKTVDNNKVVSTSSDSDGEDCKDENVPVSTDSASKMTVQAFDLPDIEPKAKGGEWILNEDDIRKISIGCGVLGTGGGGSTYINEARAVRFIEEGRKSGKPFTIRVVDPDDVEDNASWVPVAFMGAPTILLERPPSMGQVCVVALSSLFAVTVLFNCCVLLT